MLQYIGDELFKQQWFFLVVVGNIELSSSPIWPGAICSLLNSTTTEEITCWIVSMLCHFGSTSKVKCGGSKSWGWISLAISSVSLEKMGWIKDQAIYMPTYKIPYMGHKSVYISALYSSY